MGSLAQPPHIAILPSPGMGHLTPCAELARRLAADHGFAVTLITFSDLSSLAQSSFLAALPAGVSSLILPSVPLADLPAGAHLITLLAAVVDRSLPNVRSALQSLHRSNPLSALVFDIFCGDAAAAAGELGIPPYLYFPSPLFVLAFMLHLPALDRATSGEFRDLPKPVQIPGCLPVWGEDLPVPVQNRSGRGYHWFLSVSKMFREAEGILVNSFEALEPGPAKALMAAEEGRPPVYPVGPMVWTGEGPAQPGSESECLKWLDEQPKDSVVYVSFGSGGTISAEQTEELALGLELSGQRFLWVVRVPSESADGAFLGGQEGSPRGFLPEGFSERTRGVGFVVRHWAPQVEVLGHAATGGFVSHCGWNSTLESMRSGVPMVAWPLYSEQRMNAVNLVEGAGVALRMEGAGSKAVVGRERIAGVVRELMEGEMGKKVRERMRGMREAGVAAMAGREGSSHKALAEVAAKWRSSC